MTGNMPTAQHLQIAVAEQMHRFEQQLDEDGGGDPFIQGCVAAFAYVLGIASIPLDHPEPVDMETIIVLGTEMKDRITDAATDLELQQMVEEQP